MKDKFIKKLRNRTARVAVFGLGRIGLPISTIITKTGYQVLGVDINSNIVDSISKGKGLVNEPDLINLVKQAIESGLLKVTVNGSTAVKEIDIIIICVPTPIKKDKTPDLSYLENVCKTIAHNLSRDKLIIIESTMSPRTTKTYIAPILENISGLRCGLDFWLVHCPESLTPGKALKEFIENNKIIGGYNAESAELAAEFFKTFIKGKIILTDATVAEVSKLAENTYRDVNIAFANQLALICEQHGVDAEKVIEFANTHPRVNIHKPGPGVGGPCLPKDPYLLIHKIKPTDQSIIIKARQINDYMPKHIIKLILQTLKNTGKDVNNSKIAILGTAYKGNVDDSRLSPSEPIIHELIHLGVKTIVYEPYCIESFEAKRASSLNEAIVGADCLVIITDHTEFNNLNLQEIKTLMNRNPAIIDGRRIINPQEAENLGILYYGVGFGKRIDV